jgi:hypothetical protein
MGDGKAGALLVKLRAPLNRIEAHADMINMKVN